MKKIIIITILLMASMSFAEPDATLELTFDGSSENKQMGIDYVNEVLRTSGKVDCTGLGVKQCASKHYSKVIQDEITAYSKEKEGEEAKATVPEFTVEPVEEE